MADNQTTGKGWLQPTIVCVLAGAAGSVLTLLCILGHATQHQPRPVMIALSSAETMVEIEAKAQARLVDRVVNPLFEGIEHVKQANDKQYKRES